MAGLVQQAEGEATKIATLLAGVAASDQQAKEAAAAVQTASTTAQTRITELAGQVETAAQTAAAAESRVQASAQATEEFRRRVQADAEEASKSKGDSSASAQASKTDRDSTSADATATKELRTRAETVLGEITTYKSQAEANQKATASLAATAADIEKRTQAYQVLLDELHKANEARLTELHGTNTDRLKDLVTKIESLLPAATSTGLAAAFEARKAAVIKSQRLWLNCFAGSLMLLALVATAFALWPGLLGSSSIAGTALPATADQLTLTWELAILPLLRRLLVAGPILWFAIFSGRQLKTLFRLEEEYAHKVVMSNSFEGYKREIAEITEASGPSAKLTESVLEVLRRSPVRLYESKGGADSPLETLGEGGLKAITALTRLAEVLAKRP